MIRLRELIKRSGQSLLVVMSLAFICLILAWTHSGPGAGHMDGDGMQANQLVLMCMAVLAAGSVMVAAVAGVVHLRRLRAPRELRPMGTSPNLVPALLVSARSRAGPETLQVFRR